MRSSLGFLSSGGRGGGDCSYEKKKEIMSKVDTKKKKSTGLCGGSKDELNQTSAL